MGDLQHSLRVQAEYWLLSKWVRMDQGEMGHFK